MKFKFGDRVEVIDEDLEEFHGFRLEGDVIDFMKEEGSNGYVLGWEYLVSISDDDISFGESWFDENKLKLKEEEK